MLLAIVAASGLVLGVQVFVGFDTFVRWAVSVASNPRQPGGGPPESRNWAGYAATGGTFTAVSATWKVPEFAPDSPAGADAIWVGIGGVSGNDLIQAGTQETVSGHGRTEYQAWVVEAPSARRGRLLPLDAFGSVGFTQAAAVKDGRTLSVAQAGGRPITMIAQRGRPLARPSSLEQDGASFKVEQSLL